MLTTLTEALERLAAAGFVDDLILDDGRLRGVASKRRFRPEDLEVVEFVRFEGTSNPDDEAIVAALATRDGDPVGTYTVPYGVYTDAADAKMLTHLQRRAP